MTICSPIRGLPCVACLLALACACSSVPRSASPGPQPASSPVARRAAPASGVAGAQPVSSAEHCAHHPPLAADAPLPGESLYQLPAQLTDQRGAALELAAFRGRPLLVTMFYSSCTSICPMLIGQLQRIEAALEPQLRAQTRVLLISLDPERDTTPRLAELAARHGVDERRWSFTRTSEASVREAAALLGVRYRRLPDGQISHSPVISLLDQNGVLVTRVEGALNDPAGLAAAIARLLVPPATRLKG